MATGRSPGDRLPYRPAHPMGTGLSARRSVGERGHVLSCQQPQIGPPDGIGRGVVAAFHLFHELVGGREDHGLRIICADNDAVSQMTTARSESDGETPLGRGGRRLR